ncbi:MAG: type II toxin-antitoxin system VapC family toxin [bacterium]
MYYVDTSVLAAYYCPEPLSEKVEEYILGNDQPVISNLVEVELCSAISRKVREGGIKKNDAVQIIKKFLSHLDEGFYIKLPIESNHYRLAREWIRQFNTALSTLDALHLAAAFSKGLRIITADRSLSKPAEILSIDIIVL